MHFFGKVHNSLAAGNRKWPKWSKMTFLTTFGVKNGQKMVIFGDFRYFRGVLLGKNHDFRDFEKITFLPL